MTFKYPELGRLGIESLDYCASIEISAAPGGTTLLEPSSPAIFGRYSDSSGHIFARAYAGWIDDAKKAHLHVDFARASLFKSTPPATDMLAVDNVLNCFVSLDAMVDLDVS